MDGVAVEIGASGFDAVVVFFSGVGSVAVVVVVVLVVSVVTAAAGCGAGSAGTGAEELLAVGRGALSLVTAPDEVVVVLVVVLEVLVLVVELVALFFFFLTFLGALVDSAFVFAGVEEVVVVVASAAGARPVTSRTERVAAVRNRANRAQDMPTVLAEAAPGASRTFQWTRRDESEILTRREQDPLHRPQLLGPRRLRHPEVRVRQHHPVGRAQPDGQPLARIRLGRRRGHVRRHDRWRTAAVGNVRCLALTYLPLLGVSSKR